jgi:aspartyl-tRNA(Asn)/glutamyl-tRNA(Gln) amidotransferase subunit C
VKITKEEILHVAHLARLELDEAAIEKYADQIGEVLAYVDMLKRLDTQGIRPTSHAISLTNAFRDDEPREQLAVDEALANAPERDEDSFIVPKVVG